MKPKISYTNLVAYLEAHLWTLTNAGDEHLWDSLGKFFGEIVTNNDIVHDGEETHHLRVDAEHMYPYIDEGSYDGPEN